MKDALVGYSLLVYRIEQLEEWRQAADELLDSVKVWLRITTIVALTVHPLLVAFTIKQIVGGD